MILRSFFKFAILCSLIFGCIAAPNALAQVSVNVPVSDPVYRDIDLLIAHGLIDKIILGQKPYSRTEIARLVAEAKAHLPRLSPKPSDSSAIQEHQQRKIDYLKPILDRLEVEYAEELLRAENKSQAPRFSFHPLEKVETSIDAVFSPPRPLKNNNGLGVISAVVQPIMQYREGRNFIDGTTLSLETAHWLRLGDHVAFYARPRFQLAFSRDDSGDDHSVTVQNLYAKFYLKNIELEIGRDSVFWGQGSDSGFIASRSPRGFDLIKLSNDRPIFLPWIFKYLGPNKFSFFYSDLGPSSYFPHSYLLGYKWSFQPLTFLEFGFTASVEGGGDGSPGTFTDRLVDALLVKGPDVEVSNKEATAEMHLRIPPLRNTQVYLEFGMEDFGTLGDSARKWLIDDAGWLLGIYVPRLDDLGKFDLRFEYHRTGVRYYRHYQFFTGWTLNDFMRGDALGPDAQGFYLTSRAQLNPKDLLTFKAAFETRRNDEYTIEGFFYEFVKINDLPDEHRLRLGLSWQHRFEKFPMLFEAGLTYERAQNFNFVAGQSRNNLACGISFRFNFDEFSSYRSRSRH